GVELVTTQQVQDARHANARAVLALGQPAGRGRALAQGARLVIRIERQSHAHARPVLPAGRLQGASGPYLVHRGPPARLVPGPGRIAGAVAGGVVRCGTRRGAPDDGSSGSTTHGVLLSSWLGGR